MKLRNLFRSKTDPAGLEASAALRVQSLLGQAETLRRAGRGAEARAAYRAVLDLDAENLAASSALAAIALEAGQFDEAIHRYGDLIERRPESAECHYKRGNAFNRAGRWPAALADYERAIALDPEYAVAFCNRGAVLERLERPGDALTSYDRALALDPKDAFAHYNRAGVLRQLGRLSEAVAGYDLAIAVNGGYAEAFVNRGHVLQSLARPREAAASYGRAIELTSGLPPTVVAGRTVLRPEQKNLLGLRLHAKMQICDWQDMDADLGRIREGLGAGLPVTLPFPLFAMLDDPRLQRLAAEAWIREEIPVPMAEGTLLRARSPKIRLGYFSADFRTHPVAYLAAGLFERHDRSRFEVIAFSFGPETNDTMRARMSKAFDRFIDVRLKSDAEIAALARDLGIDIAINLNGITEHSRSNVFALRAAPIQISYLGYPGTMGAGFIDYLIADGTVVPRTRQSDYAEKIIYLPESFMPFDSSYAIADKAFSREELGLPSTGFVFCCFNNSFKITPDTFDRWMSILIRSEASVLWLSKANPEAAANLRAAAARRGVDGRRLIFAERMDSLPEHLARLRAADLFLDTFPYNAHATALDALWAGLPVLTCAGVGFASRVAASLLHSLDLPELIAASLGEYEEMAVSFAADPRRLQELRGLMAQRREEARLFDTARYLEGLEAAYEAVVARHDSGAAPAHMNEHLAP